MGLLQTEVALLLYVNPATALNWEKGHTEPPVTSFPAILEFLGYDPFPMPKTVPEYLFTKRRQMGWSIKEAAVAVGVDPSTWGHWEKGRIILFRKHRAAIAELLNMNPAELNEEMATRWGSLQNQASV